MNRSRTLCGWLAGFLCVFAFHSTISLWSQESEGSPEEWTDVEMETFLRTAEILSSQTTTVGSTRPERATLVDASGVTHDALIQTIDVFRRGLTPLAGGGFSLNFKDTYKFNIAAYRLDRLIGLDMVPVYAERRVDRRSASMSWWLEVQMDERERIEGGIEPPDVDTWNDQMANARMFTELIYNTDPNLGNILITNDWQIRLIDFTRAFRLFKELRKPENVGECIDRGVYEGLEALNKETLETVMDDLLSGSEIDSILVRRDLILEIYDTEIAQRGEAAVICNLPWH